MAVYLLSLRIGALLLMNPVFPGLGGFPVLRVLLTLSLSAVLVSGFSLTAEIPDVARLVSASLAEIAVGATLAFGVFCAFAAFSVGGKLLDVQSGLGLGAVFDPLTRSGAPLFGTLLGMAALAVFLAVDGHHMLMRGLVFSIEQVPLGSGFRGVPLEAVAGQFGLMFSLSVAVVGPVVFVLFLVEVALAVMSRLMPQMNVFLVSVPLKIAITISLLAISTGPLKQAMSRAFRSISIFWQQVLA
jgi:flagellar biosynthesis protein FliR